MQARLAINNTIASRKSDSVQYEISFLLLPAETLVVQRSKMSFSSRTAGLTAFFVLSFSSLFQCQSVPNASLLVGGGTPGGVYQLADDYEPTIFFSKFNFYDASIAL